MTIFTDVQDEMDKQDNKWGTERVHTNDRWMLILTEEVLEAGEASLKNERENMREELVQVAAVAMQILRAMDENRLVFEDEIQITVKKAPKTGYPPQWGPQGPPPKVPVV